MSMEQLESGVLAFYVANSCYGLPLSQVVEVVRAVEITPLPKAPPVIEGVINLRGSVVPVFDLRARFGLPSKPVSLSDRFVIARTRQRMVAIRADRAEELIYPEHGDVTEMQRILRTADLVTGIVRHSSGLVLIHDLEHFLSHAEAMKLDAVLATEETALCP